MEEVDGSNPSRSTKFASQLLIIVSARRRPSQRDSRSPFVTESGANNAGDFGRNAAPPLAPHLIFFPDTSEARPLTRYLDVPHRRFTPRLAPQIASRKGACSGFAGWTLYRM